MYHSEDPYTLGGWGERGRDSLFPVALYFRGLFIAHLSARYALEVCALLNAAYGMAQRA